MKIPNEINTRIEHIQATYKMDSLKNKIEKYRLDDKPIWEWKFPTQEEKEAFISDMNKRMKEAGYKADIALKEYFKSLSREELANEIIEDIFSVLDAVAKSSSDIEGMTADFLLEVSIALIKKNLQYHNTYIALKVIKGDDFGIEHIYTCIKNRISSLDGINGKLTYRPAELARKKKAESKTDGKNTKKPGGALSNAISKVIKAGNEENFNTFLLCVEGKNGQYEFSNCRNVVLVKQKEGKVIKSYGIHFPNHIELSKTERAVAFALANLVLEYANEDGKYTRIGNERTLTIKAEDIAKRFGCGLSNWRKMIKVYPASQNKKIQFLRFTQCIDLTASEDENGTSKDSSFLPFARLYENCGDIIFSIDENLLKRLYNKVFVPIPKFHMYYATTNPTAYFLADELFTDVFRHSSRKIDTSIAENVLKNYGNNKIGKEKARKALTAEIEKVTLKYTYKKMAEWLFIPTKGRTRKWSEDVIQPIKDNLSLIAKDFEKVYGEKLIISFTDESIDEKSGKLKKKTAQKAFNELDGIEIKIPKALALENEYSDRFINPLSAKIRKERIDIESDIKAEANIKTSIKKAEAKKKKIAELEMEIMD